MVASAPMSTTRPWAPSIVYTTSSGGESTVAFSRYYNSSVPDHWVTTGSVTAGYNLESTLGYLYTAQQTGTVPYGCLVNGWDHMISPQSNCEGTTVLNNGQPEGYIYSSRPKVAPWNSTGAAPRARITSCRRTRTVKVRP